jgi:hypothetical protein
MLRRRQAVVEYTANPACVFRLEIARSRRALTLRDGTQLRIGERIAQLHFWNEQIPQFPQNGATIGWARQAQQRMAVSLCELVHFLSSRPDLADVAVICADVPASSKAQSRQVAAIMAHYGFESIPAQDKLTFGERLHRLGEGVLISLLIWARNAGALRLGALKRVRVPIYMSRARLLKKFGGAKDAALAARGEEP